MIFGPRTTRRPPSPPARYTETVGDYTLTWTIIDSTPVPGSKRINLTASWQTMTGTKTARLTTFVTAN